MKRIRKSLSFIFGICLSLATVSAIATPAVMDVGGPLVDGQLLKPYTNAWHMTLISADGKTKRDAGTWTDKLERVTVSGQECLQRIQEAIYKDKDGNTKAFTKTINIFDTKTFAPVSRRYERHVQGGTDLSVTITFSDGHMKAEKTEDGVYTVTDSEVKPAYDFNGGIYGLLIAVTPLKPGFSARFPSYSESGNPGSIVQETYTVQAVEHVDAGASGKRDAFVIDSDSDSGPLKFWISKEPPYIIRLEFTQQGSGMKWIYEMI